MDRKSKSLFTISGLSLSSLGLIVALGFPQLFSDDTSLRSHCSKNIASDHSLPVSHPINQCASAETQKVSWLTWFSGRSSSYQFHFIDLLELLSRSGDTSQNTPTKPK